jgi:hypothetical protein
MTTTRIKINLSALQQQFHPCTADFIANVCKASCCRSSVDPSGIAVVVTSSEAVALRKRGATVDETSGRVTPVNKKCPFQHPDNHLCILHDSPDKPSGCIVSPFTINKTNTLIVRNRYRMLPCFKAEGSQPVYMAHRDSLSRIFGLEQAEWLISQASNPELQGTTVYLEVPGSLVEALQHKNAASKAKA